MRNDSKDGNLTLTITLVWSAFVFSQLILGLVLFLMPDICPPGSTDCVTREIDKNLPLIFAGVALWMGGLSFFLKSFILKTSLGPLLKRDSEEYQSFQSKPKTEQHQDILRKAFTAHVISWACCEAISILGFVLSFMSLDQQYYLYFASVGIFLTLLHKCTPESVIAKAEQPGL